MYTFYLCVCVRVYLRTHRGGWEGNNDFINECDILRAFFLPKQHPFIYTAHPLCILLPFIYKGKNKNPLITPIPHSYIRICCISYNKFNSISIMFTIASDGAAGPCVVLRSELFVCVCEQNSSAYDWGSVGWLNELRARRRDDDASKMLYI